MKRIFLFRLLLVQQQFSSYFLWKIIECVFSLKTPALLAQKMMLKQEWPNVCSLTDFTDASGRLIV